jgi:hypothetical protein
VLLFMMMAIRIWFVVFVMVVLTEATTTEVASTAPSLRSSVSRRAQEEATNQTSPAAAPGGSASSQTEDSDDSSPGAVQWVLAFILIAMLVAGLMRVYRVLQIAGNVSPMRHVPDGMRSVECGACRTAQYAASHGRIFICFSCRQANRLPVVELPRVEVQELVSPTGPLRRYEFSKGGEILWQEIKSEDIEEGAATEEAIAKRDEPTVIGARSRDGVQPTVIGARARENPAGNEDSTSRVSVGSIALESETESNASGVSRHTSASRRSHGGLPHCVVCLDSPGCMVLIPCGHGGVCEECCTRIAQNRASGGAHCPHCRSGIQKLVKISEINGSVAKGIEYRIPMARPAPTAA